MIAYLLKNWKLLLDLILVVGGIVLITLFDPFGLFTSSKLKSTANLVTSIRGIGELVTAEYYGEVISSLHDTKISNVVRDDLISNFEKCHRELRYVIVSVFLDDRKINGSNWNKVADTIKSRGTYDSLESNSEQNYFTTLYAFLAVQYLGKTPDKYVNLKSSPISLQKNTVKKVLKELIKEDFRKYIKALGKKKNDIEEEDLERFINGFPEGFAGITEFHQFLKDNCIYDKKSWKKAKKKDIVFIGRGWVKAGFRFDRLDESNFYYDEDDKLVQFYGLTPVILDKDINPWFIPEEKIKGFELVDAPRGVGFKQAKLVKKKCKEKLLDQAKGAGIINSARDNGREALRNFFSLLLDEPELRVELLDLPYKDEYEMIAADTLVTIKEALLIRDIYQQMKSKQESFTPGEQKRELRKFQIFLGQLQKLNFLNSDFQFSILSLEAAEVLQRGLYLTQNDYDSMKSSRTKLDTLESGELSTKLMVDYTFFDDYNQFIRQYNQMLLAIDDHLDEIAFLREDTLDISKDQALMIGLDLGSSHLSTEIISSSGEQAYRITHKEEKAPKFIRLRYPDISLNRIDLSGVSVFETDSLDLRVGALVTAYKEAHKSSVDDETVFDADVDLISKFKRDSIERAIKLKPLHNIQEGLRVLAINN